MIHIVCILQQYFKYAILVTKDMKMNQNMKYGKHLQGHFNRKHYEI